MAAVSKNIYSDTLDDFVDKYDNTYHTTIKMKPIDVKSGLYAEYSVDSTAKDAQFKLGNRERISKNKNLFAKGYASNGSEIPCHRHMILVILMVK